MLMFQSVIPFTTFHGNEWVYLASTNNERLVPYTNGIYDFSVSLCNLPSTFAYSVSLWYHDDGNSLFKVIKVVRYRTQDFIAAS